MRTWSIFFVAWPKEGEYQLQIRLLLEAPTWWSPPWKMLSVILGIGEHWQKWKQVGLFEFLLLPKKLLITLKAC
jgi:hypothetical protein